MNSAQQRLRREHPPWRRTSPLSFVSFPLRLSVEPPRQNFDCNFGPDHVSRPRGRPSKLQVDVHMGRTVKGRSRTGCFACRRYVRRRSLTARPSALRGRPCREGEQPRKFPHGNSLTQPSTLTVAKRHSPPWSKPYSTSGPPRRAPFVQNDDFPARAGPFEDRPSSEGTRSRNLHFENFFGRGVAVLWQLPVATTLGRKRPIWPPQRMRRRQATGFGMTT